MTERSTMSLTSAADPAAINAAVTEYLAEAEIVAGATAEQAAQIEQNKTDIDALKKNAVKTVNGIAPDESGNVEIEVGSGATQSGDINAPEMWEQGHIKTADGTNGVSGVASYTARIRTIDYLPSSVTRVASTPLVAQFRVFRYNPDGTYVDYQANLYEYTDFDFTSYQYRLDINKDAASNIEIDTSFYSNVEIWAETASDASSPLQKNIDRAAAPFDYYAPDATGSYNLFTADSTSDDVYGAFDALASGYNSYITKTDLGVCSDGSKHLYCYDFKPARLADTKTKPMPKIIIISGQHGNEKCAPYGLYYLMHDIVKNWASGSVLDYLRHYVHLIVVPVVNRYGFDNTVYKNANGVDINRNYDCTDWAEQNVTDTTSDKYGGAEAFDQPESRIVRDLILANTDAVYFCDYHTNGGTSVSQVSEINWHSLESIQDSYYNRLHGAVVRHLSRITDRMDAAYSIGIADGTLAGYLSTNTGGMAKTYATASGVMGSTFEGFCGFPGKDVYTADAQRGNAEILGNWLMAVIRETV